MNNNLEANSININQIREILLHRYPFLLVDRVLEYEIHKYLKAIKNVSINEPFFQGHFPNHPIFPGVLIVEACAQASAILASQGLVEKPEGDVVFLLAGVDKTRFKRPVSPGDQLLIEVTQTGYKNRIWKYATKASVDDKVVAVTNITFTYR